MNKTRSISIYKFMNHLNSNPRTPNRIAALLLCLAALTNAIQLHAHPISMGQAYVNVEKNRVDVEMAIMVEDLVLFQDLKPSEGQRYSVESIREAAIRHKEFLKDYFQIRKEDGSRAPSEVTSMNLAEIEAQPEGIEAIDIMKYFVRYRIEFELEEPLKYMTLLQRFGGDSNPVPSVLDVALYREESLVSPPFKLEHNRPQVFEFDWDAPPQETPRSWRERKKLMDERNQQRLGITSYSSVYSFFYITDTEVRHEILVPLLILEKWVDIQRENPDVISVAEQTAMKDTVINYFLNNNPVSIDNQSVPAKLDRLKFFSLDIKDFAKETEPKELSAYNARVGIILSYPTPESPQKVTLQWDTFGEHTQFLRLAIYEFEKDPTQIYLVPEQNTYEWTAEERRTIPFPEPVVADSKYNSNREIRNIPEPEAKSILTGLHENLYLAFKRKDESATFDALAVSVSGELLTDLYLQWIESLKMEEQGGAVATVRDVEIVDFQTVDAPPPSFPRGEKSFDANVTWTVEGEVEHWGHRHTRKNQFSGVFRVSLMDDAWNFTQFHLDSKERLSFDTGLRLAQ